MAAAIAALEEYVAHRKRIEVLTLFGTIDFDPDWEYKAERRRAARPKIGDR